MKPIQQTIVLSLIFLLAPISLLSAAETGKEWNARDAVAFALKNSPDSSIAQKKIEAAQAFIQQSSSGKYPRINLSSSYTQTNNPMYSFGNILNQQEFSQDIDFNDPGRTDNLQLKAELKYRIFQGGSIQASIQAAENRKESMMFMLQAVHNKLGFEVVRLYHSIIQAQEMVHARKSGLDAIHASLEVATARYEAGDLLRQNLLNIQLQKSRAKEELISANHSLALTKRAFFNLLGLESGDQKIQSSDLDQQEQPETTTPVNRPELKQYNLLVQVAEAGLKQVKGARYPAIDAFANYQVNTGFETDGTGNSWMAGIQVDYLLFDGKRTESRISKARIQLQETLELKRKLQLNINLEYEQARLKLQQARERLTVTENMVDTAIESARLTRARFKEGVVLASELIDAETRLTEARVHKSSANAMRKIAIADLRRAIGLPQFN